MLNEDYKDMLQCFAAEGVRFLLVGAYALAAHGYPRATLDIGFWVDPTRENARAVLRALARFGAPLDQLSEDDMTRHDTIFQMGVPPRRIDIITGADGLSFEETHARAQRIEVDGMGVRIPNREDMIRNKRASGRKKDLLDAEWLEENP
mgnify:CR=1 FL=1